MNPHPNEYRAATKTNRHARSQPRWRERRFAWPGAALAIAAALAGGCAAAPRTPPDPAVAAAVARDGQRLFAAPSPASRDEARRGMSAEPSAAARDDAREEEGR